MRLLLFHRSKDRRSPFIFAAVTTLLIFTAIAAFFLLTTNSTLYMDPPVVKLHNSQATESQPSYSIEVPSIGPEKESQIILASPPPNAAVRIPPSSPEIAPERIPPSMPENTSDEATPMEIARKEEHAPVEEEDVRKIQWTVCGGTVATDYIPCLDNYRAIKRLKSRRHMEHRERHCPNPNLRCLVPLPKGYRVHVPWPRSRDMVSLLFW